MYSYDFMVLKESLDNLIDGEFMYPRFDSPYPDEIVFNGKIVLECPREGEIVIARLIKRRYEK